MMKSSDSSSELFADEFNQTSDCHVEYSKRVAGFPEFGCLLVTCQLAVGGLLFIDRIACIS